MAQALTKTCYLGFDCKSMTGFNSSDCPNIHICGANYARQYTRNDYSATQLLPYYIDRRNNALTVDRCLPSVAREVGWHAALRLPYNYENGCLSVDTNLYYYENPQSVQIELALSGWLPPQQLFWQIIDGHARSCPIPRRIFRELFK